MASAAHATRRTSRSKDPRTWISPRGEGIVELSFFHLVWIFALCCVVGLVVETIVSYPRDGVWKDRAGLLWGPFSPIYGLGAVLFTVSLNRLGNAPKLLVFFVAAVVGATFEYLVGWFWESAFGIVAWSYQGTWGDIGGHTSVWMAAIWGVAGLAWHLAVPSVVRLIDRIPRMVRAPLTALLAAFLALDIAATFVGISCWFDRMSGEEPQGVIEEYFAEHYDDEFMAERFETMSMWPELATLRD